MRILLLNAYDTDSHHSWCQGLMKHLPQHEWNYLSLPGRFFSWRIRGNPLSFALGEHQKILSQSFDLIVATSMVDLATLKGLIPRLGNTPSVIYFHENQFAYPKSQLQHTSVEPQMVNLYSALSADKVIFNSEYNQNSFLAGIESLFKKLPDHAPLSALDVIRQKSQVLPVPIHVENSRKNTHFIGGNTLKVIWNHRWEYDKGPDTLITCIKLAQDKKLNIDLTICGMAIRQWPKEFEQLKALQPNNLKHMGTFESRDEYLTQLTQHHVVLSTAIHEFQGLAILEGASAGCIPLVPDRLAYPEWVPNKYRFTSNDSRTEAIAICEQLHYWQQNGLPETISVSRYDWQQLAPYYDQAFIKTIESHNRHK